MAVPKQRRSKHRSKLKKKKWIAKSVMYSKHSKIINNLGSYSFILNKR
uniref:Ribosomal protein L32 n=1 Tax=Pterocladiophila hemisphaerica TaxID=2712948 RepID=A0A6M3WW99_9FLOR|nr:ribosomal protein L32 [Pterocladiophila hemisphaerica]